jgi:TonB family protein
MRKPFFFPMTVLTFIIVLVLSFNFTTLSSRAEGIPFALPTATEPSVIKFAAPVFPDSFGRFEWQDFVIAIIQIDKLSKVVDVSISRSSGHPEVDNVVFGALSRSHYKPATRNGKPVSGMLQVPFAIFSSPACYRE